MAVKALDIPAFRARQTGGARQGPLSRHRLCDLLRAHRLRHAGLRRARHGDHAGLGDGRHQPWTRPASSRRASAPRRTARGCAPRWRRSSPTSSASRRITIKIVHGDTDRTPYGWGTFASRSLVICRRRHPARGAQGARQADPDRQPPAGGERPTTSCWRTARRRSPERTARSRSHALARAAYHADASLRRRDRARA